MGIITRSGSLLVLSLVPAAAVGGCFSSSSTTAPGPRDASTDAVTGMGDAQPHVDATADAPTGVVDAAADQKAPPPSAGGTGAFGIITIGGKQKMYLPQLSGSSPTGNATIVVVDVGAAGNGVNGAPAQIATIDLGSPNFATATGGDSSVVIAVSTYYNTVYFIDPTTDTLTKTIALDASFGKSSFSGGGGYVTGVAIDSAHHRAILSVWNGFAIVDLTTKSISRVIEAPPTENFGFDSVHQWILAPFYQCASSAAPNPDGGSDIAPASCDTPKQPDGGVMSAGLSVIDLSDNTVYTYVSPASPPDGGLLSSYDPATPVGSTPDSAAADPTTGVVVIPAEFDGWQNVIDLSRATFDKTTRTVTAPQQIVPNLDLEGVAVEPSRHLAFLESEGTGDVAVFDLTQANAGGTAAVRATMPSAPSGVGFTNIGDPHGIAVATAITTSGPVGFVVNSDYQWVARIDLAGMLAAGGPDGSATLTDVMMTPYVTFLDALTPESASSDSGTEAGDGSTDAAGQ